MKVFESKKASLLLTLIPGVGLTTLYKHFRWSLDYENIDKPSLLDYSVGVLFSIHIYHMVVNAAAVVGLVYVILNY